MSDKKLLNPANSCPFTGVEIQLKSPIKEVKIYRDNFNRLRFLYVHNFDTAISGLLIEKEGNSKHYTILQRYTKEDERQKGYAKQLLAFARYHLDCEIRHSQYLTEDGQKAAK